MALSSAAGLALRRVTSTFVRRLGCELPSWNVGLNGIFPLQTPSTLVNKVAYNVGTSPKSLLHVRAMRNMHRKVAGPSIPKTSIRHFSIVSPLLIGQSSPVFLTFSRRQWYYFFGGLTVLGVITVQYMEIGAVEKLLSGVDEAVLKSPTLAVELFGAASTFTSSPSCSTMARNEPLIALSCLALVKPDIEDIVRASAILFLNAVWVDDVCHPLIYKHLNVTSFARDFIKIVKKSDFERTSAVLLAAALATRPPSADRTKSLEIRQQALQQVYPILMAHFLGKVASNPSFHGALLAEGTHQAMLQLAQREVETPIGADFFYHLTSSSSGCRALLETDTLKDYLTVTNTPSSPLFAMYNASSFDEHTPLYLAGIASNMTRYLSPTRFGSASSDILTPEQKEYSDFDLNEQLRNKRLLAQVSASTASVLIACIYAPMRGLLRNWWRSYTMSVPQAILHATWRAAIGAPLLVLGGCFIKDARKDLKDDRLFITAATLGSTGALFATRFILSAAPFALIPAAFAYASTFGGSPAQRAAQRLQIERFQSETNNPDNHLTDELDDE